MKRVVQLIRATATNGGTAGTGVLDVERFHSLLVHVSNGGVAVSGALNGYIVDEASNQNLYRTVASLALNSSDLGFSIGRDAAGSLVPVPRRGLWTAVAGVGATLVVLTVYGVYEDDT